MIRVTRLPQVTYIRWLRGQQLCLKTEKDCRTLPPCWQVVETLWKVLVTVARLKIQTAWGAINLEDIVVFVEKQARAASHPVFGDISARSWDHERVKNSYSKPKGKIFATKGDDEDQGRTNKNKEDRAGERSGNPKNCPKCRRDHYLHDCPEFKRESSEKCAQFVRSKRLCFNGLKPYHRVRDCRKKGASKDCGRKHSYLILQQLVVIQAKIRIWLANNQRIPLDKDVNQLPQRSTMVLLTSSLHFGVLQECQRQRLVCLLCP